MAELHGRAVGFISPATEQNVAVRRTGIELAATVGLAVALVIAATAVSIGMARARAFGGVAHRDTSLAIAAAGLTVVAAGWGGLNALVARDTTLPPRS